VVNVAVAVCVNVSVDDNVDDHEIAPVR